MNDLERHVLRLVGENLETPDVFTDDSEGLRPIRDSLNDAIEEMCMLTASYRRRYLLTTMEERAVYRLAPQNDDIGWVIGAWRRDNHLQLEQTDVWALAGQDPRWLKRSGDPTHFWQAGWNYLGLYPRPGTKGMIIELDCISIPLPYEHNMQPIRLKEAWSKAAVYRACSDFMASRGDAKRAAEFLAQYIETAGLQYLQPETNERQFRMGGYQREAWQQGPKG